MLGSGRSTTSFIFEAKPQAIIVGSLYRPLTFDFGIEMGTKS